MSIMGSMVDGLRLPVCDKFERKIIEDRICYQIDVNEFSENVDKKKFINDGLLLVLDYNEEKMLSRKKMATRETATGLSDIRSSKNSDEEESLVYVETLGEI